MIFFLNSANRVYKDEELNKVASLLFSNGIFNTLTASLEQWRASGDFKVEASGADMNITAKAGSATIALQSDGNEVQTIIHEDVALSASVASNLSLAVRSDAVVLRIDQSVIDGDTLNAGGTNAVSLVVISGNSATALTDTEIAVALGNDPFIRLANISVPLSTSVITNQMIEDTRALPKMTQAAQFASDSFKFNAIGNDPEVLESGMVWFNLTEGILKFYDGVNTTALQTQDFNWGYYPPDGVDQNVNDFEAVLENPGEVGVSARQVYKVIDVLGGPGSTLMVGQLFEMPAVQNPFIKVKMGNPDYSCGVVFKVYAVDGSNNPTSLIETSTSFGAGSVPKNDYLNFYLNGALYTPGTKYFLVCQSNLTGFINGDDEDFLKNEVVVSTYEDSPLLLGTRQGFLANVTDNPLSVTWGSLSASVQFVLSIAERDEIAIGEADNTGKNYIVTQTFAAKSEDITGFSVIKGANVGSPTGDVQAKLYLADNNNLPSGDVIREATITAANWAVGSSGAEKIFNISYDKLVIGQKYVIVIDTTVHNNDNYYTIYFGTVATGTAKRQNTADGYVTLSGNLFYSVLTSPVRKIIVANNQGKIPAQLLPKYYPNVTYITSSATPAFSVDTADAVSITALATAITSMTTNKLGTPRDFQRLIVRFKDNGTARAITWGADYEARGVALPTTTVINKVTTVTLEYSTVSNKWGCIASVTEA